mmetsp:Transcript_18196/g.45219  ORF Transcript_18196/g.45219 Transcript_18196/m.45219 type:complete len:502 (+) Transcript_18196:42-1547(+)
MKFSLLNLILFVGSVLPTEGTFQRDVLRKQSVPSTKDALKQTLLNKAIPLEQYEKQLNELGMTLSRRMEDAGDDAVEEEEYENEDDYYVNEYNWMNYTGYSFKYAKCQPVQRFSERAVEAGEYSPMIVNDIVILRLCPSEYCSDSRAYGCSSDYVEYAIDLTEYIRIMLRYELDRKQQLCNWCDACEGNNRLLAQRYYYTYDENGNMQVSQEYVQDDDGYNSNIDCTDYGSFCLDSYNNTVCGDNNDDARDDDDNHYHYLDEEEYMDIIGCTQINGGYFLRPRCDAYSETLSMGIYHDKFCSHYAGSEVNLRDFNTGINASYFDQFGTKAGCQDCSESYDPPYFNANSNVCNRLDVDSAKCTSSASSYSSLQNYTSSDTESCSFIDSVRFGTYDADGQLYMESNGSNRKITTSQKWLLVLSMLICGILAVYSCYLHHAITNLLIKSLSHTDLLPPAKYRRRTPSNSGGRRKSPRARSTSRKKSPRSKPPLVNQKVVNKATF